jgi:hypothetical protein
MVTGVDLALVTGIVVALVTGIDIIGICAGSGFGSGSSLLSAKSRASVIVTLARRQISFSKAY